MLMYSKPGKISQEMFPWIQQRDVILNGPKSGKYQNPFFDDIPHSKGNFNQFREGIKSTSPKRITNKMQPFSKLTGREEPKKDNHQGFYKPKYHLVFTRSPLIEQPDPFKELNQSTISKRKSKSKKIIEINQITDDFVTKPLPQPKGYVDLKKQVKDEMFPLPEGPNEKRFEYLQYPQSQYQRSPKPFIKPVSRQKKQKENKNGQMYDLNYSAIHPKSDKIIPIFQKLVSRPQFGSEKKIYTLNESLSNDNFSKSRSFSIDKQIPRETALSQYNSIRRLYYL